MRKSGDFSLRNLLGIVIFSFLMSLNSYAQLANFQLNVVATDETCIGNGTMTFTVDNPTPGATILYSVYLLPNTTNSIYTSTEPFVGSLNAGTYQVVAIQTLGTESSSVTQEVIIQNQIVPLTYTISSMAHNCDVGGEIVITTTSGTAVGYEIISGPQIMPLQQDSIFYNMQQGTYNIRVFDECGQGVVTTYTLDLTPAPPVVSPPLFNSLQNGDCNNVTISNTISYPDGTAITYPLTIVYTVYPPGGGAPEVFTEVFESGMPGFIEFSHTFPVVPGDGYTYDLQVTNGCGNTYGTQGNAVNPVPNVSMQAVPIPCGRFYLSVSTSQFSPPYTMQFIEVPEGFVPTGFGNGYPGPFTDGTVNFGGENSPVPEGTYIVKVTDACGRTGEASVEVEDVVPVPVAAGRNNGCFSDMGRVTVSVPDRQIVSASIIAAPGSYTLPLPQDVSSFINAAGSLIITNLPLGDYTLIIVDSCGHEHTVEVNIPDFEPQDFTATAYSDCTEGSGAIRVMSGNGNLIQISLISAPDAYTGNVPQNVSAFIASDGRLYMDNLPEGTYIFTGKDVCGIEQTVTVEVTGYVPGEGPVFTFEPLCNSWNITLFDGTGQGATYWLQKENAGTAGQWQHPETGAAYTEGTVPNDTTSLALPNNQTTYNLQYSGNFRVVKAIQTVGTGTASKLCFTDLGDFSYQYGVVVDGVYNVACLGNADDVYVQATGLAPLTYKITEKDGQPFLIDNGENNVFSGLEPGVYKFVVENACGQTGVAIRNVNLLPDLVTANFPGDILKCIEPGDSQYQEFNLMDTQAQILGEQSPDVYTVTYYDNITDAQNGTNAIPNPESYTNTVSPQVIYARIEHNQVNVCHELVDFIIQVSENPVIEMEEFAVICDEEGSVVLSATAGFDSYHWSTGENTRSITVTEPGDYTVTVSKDYGIGTCPGEFTITVIPSGQAEDFDLDIVDWTDNDNSITINATGIGAYEFSLNGGPYQEENTFTGLEPGLYTISIRDSYGCGEITEEVALLNYPKFFTPNGDGINDTWHINYSWYEPNLMVYVYDRYGKLITSFRGQSNGWDGRLNAHNLPSTDYWFVAERADGRIFKGHFSMIR